MDATTVRVLRELVRRHHERLMSATSGTVPSLYFRISEIVLFSSLTKPEVEDALETLIELRVVTRHSLGHFALTRTALDEFGLVTRPAAAAKR
jgi:hypothetical protein